MGVDYLANYLQLEMQKLTRLKKEYEQLGRGSLHISCHDGKIFFREYKDGIQHGITKDRNRIYQLARKDILSERIELSNKKIKVLETAIEAIEKNDNASRIDKLLERYKMLDSRKILLSEEELKIYNNRFSQNPFNKDRLKYKTTDNVSVRSKSERFIGSFIENEGLIYMYEPEVIIDGRNIYPDFMIFCPDGKKVLWEHCGLMDDVDYFNKMANKINEYRKIGYVQHKNLICTYEEDLQNIENLKDIVQRFIYT